MKSERFRKFVDKLPVLLTLIIVGLLLILWFLHQFVSVEGGDPYMVIPIFVFRRYLLGSLARFLKPCDVR